MTTAQSGEILEAAGTYSKAVSAVMCLARALWDLAYAEEDGEVLLNDTGRFRALDQTSLRAKFSARAQKSGLPEKLVSLLIDGTLESSFFVPERNVLSVDAFYVPKLGRLLLGEGHPEHQFRYFVMRDIRQTHGIVLGPRMAHDFRVLAKALSGEVARNGSDLPYRKEVLRGLGEALASSPYRGKALASTSAGTFYFERIIGAFLECCHFVEYMRLGSRTGRCSVATTAIDSEHLLSNLFGIPTGMRGFDELFGGGGLMLLDATGAESSESIQGRTVLAIGRFGTAKTALSLQMAVAVAEKGGIAWVAPLEQPVNECLYTLESLCSVPHGLRLEPATLTGEVRAVLDPKSPESGAIVLLPLSKESFDDFKKTFEKQLERLAAYPLRLIIVDPVNAISRGGEESVPELREKAVELFKNAKKNGVNVWLVAEENTDRETELHYWQNIADTVVRLSVDEYHGYTQRYIEIRKSRFQREQRGKHPFSLVPGVGLAVSPSTASVWARLRFQPILQPSRPTRFGHAGLDELLGPDAIRAGDVIVLQGPTASYKTVIGLRFLLGITSPETSQYPSLYVAAKEAESSIRAFLERELLSGPTGSTKSPANVRFLSLQGGYIKPSYIVQQIECELRKAHAAGNPVDRVMVDDLAHWEMSCLFVREDQTFGDALIELLRHYHVTSIFSCRYPTDESGTLQKAVIDGADCLIHLSRVQFRGTYRVMARVVKTRGMQHKKESFEVVVGPRFIEIKPTFALLRLAESGDLQPITIRLFLHSESDIQKTYNEEFANAVKSLFQSDVEIESPSRLRTAGILRLGSASGADDLRILQLDEFQLPSGAEGVEEQVLCRFPASEWDRCTEWRDFLPRFTDRCKREDGTFVAVPFFENIGLLAYKQTVEADMTSWRALADACVKWEPSFPEKLFFDFPKALGENYNCLFLEILLSLHAGETPPTGCRLYDWLCGPPALDAARIFYRLCQRAHKMWRTKPSQAAGGVAEGVAIEVDRSALVWRHWYTTLNHMMSKMSAADRRMIKVSPLPTQTVVAGEWYLAVAAESAAPELALRMLEVLTTPQAEMERLNRGVGLPTRQTFYERSPVADQPRARVSPYFALDMRALGRHVQTAFTRSSLGCYQEFAAALSFHLQEILELEAEKDLEQTFTDRLLDLETKVKFARPELCEQCRARVRKAG